LSIKSYSTAQHSTVQEEEEKEEEKEENKQDKTRKLGSVFGITKRTTSEDRCGDTGLCTTPEV
jgi:hypothetical protein